MAYFDFTSGEPLLASQLDSAFDVAGWTAYTPTLTNITLGNGTLSAAYAQIGKTVAVRFILTLGSTSSVSGTISVSNPVTGTSTHTGTCYMNDATGGIYNGTVIVASTTFTMRAHNSSATYSTLTAFSNTIPVAPAVNDQYVATFVYEAA
jgi:hypothetical protein